MTQLIRKPPELSWEVAGSLYVVGCTAFAAVRAVGVDRDDTVAVSAAAGGVGTVVVQLLRTRGATVIGIASRAQSRLAPGARSHPGGLWRWARRAPQGGSARWQR